ncbi:MAG: response regulator [Chloroflexi bacterium]|nr:response regulator [Chloroflexota bacterium]
MTLAEFTQHIRFALQHLYEIGILDRGPAQALLPWLDRVADPSASYPPGQRLHHLLMHTIEQMKPTEPLDPNLPRHRSYLILKRRFVDGIAVHLLESEFNTSSRQFRRESHRAVEELVAALWNLSPQSMRPAENSVPVDRAVSDNGSESTGAFTGFSRSVSAIRLLDLVVDAAQTLSVIISSTQTQVIADIQHDLPPVAADRVALRLALIKLLRVAIAHSPQHTLRLRADPQSATPSQPGAILLNVEGVAGIDTRDSAFNEAAQLFALAEGDLTVVEAVGAASQLEAGGVSDTASPGRSQRMIARLSIHHLPAVLVIDDDPAMPRIIQRFLALQPIQVISCDSTSDIVKLAREVKPVLILLDVLMPKRDGWDILQELKANPDTYHICLAVCSIWDERELAFSLGADMFFQKPIGRTELLACVERHLNQTVT